MKKVEYEKFEKLVLDSISKEDLKSTLETYGKMRGLDTTYLRAKQMVQDGCFDCYYSQVIDDLQWVYGDDFKEDVYFTKDGELRWKNDECYCWTVYEHKIALTIETMEKKGLLK